MATYKNTRATVIQRPNGKNVMPGGTFETEPGEMANPGMKVFEEAGFLTKTGDTLRPPEAKGGQADKAQMAKDLAASEKAAKDAEKAAKVLRDAQEKEGKSKRDAKISAVKVADETGLLALADGETHPDVMAAIEARAAELAPKP